VEEDRLHRSEFINNTGRELEHGNTWRIKEGTKDNDSSFAKKKDEEGR
jgi:hypothetical protein